MSFKFYLKLEFFDLVQQISPEGNSVDRIQKIVSFFCNKLNPSKIQKFYHSIFCLNYAEEYGDCILSFVTEVWCQNKEDFYLAKFFVSRFSLIKAFLKPFKRVKFLFQKMKITISLELPSIFTFIVEVQCIQKSQILFRMGFSISR